MPRCWPKLLAVPPGEWPGDPRERSDVARPGARTAPPGDRPASPEAAKDPKAAPTAAEMAPAGSAWDKARERREGRRSGAMQGIFSKARGRRESQPHGAQSARHDSCAEKLRALRPCSGHLLPTVVDIGQRWSGLGQTLAKLSRRNMAQFGQTSPDLVQASAPEQVDQVLRMSSPARSSPGSPEATFRSMKWRAEFGNLRVTFSSLCQNRPLHSILQQHRRQAHQPPQPRPSQTWPESTPSPSASTLPQK